MSEISFANSFTNSYLWLVKNRRFEDLLHSCSTFLTRLILQNKFGRLYFVHKFASVLLYGSWLNVVTKAAASINLQAELIEKGKTACRDLSVLRWYCWISVLRCFLDCLTLSLSLIYNVLMMVYHKLIKFDWVHPDVLTIRLLS
jgi:hypothetical protein